MACMVPGQLVGGAYFPTPRSGPDPPGSTSPGTFLCPYLGPLQSCWATWRFLVNVLVH